MKLTGVSLFAGVGGFDLAMERAGVQVVASVEIDKHARGILEKHFPTSKLFNDVTEVTGGQLRESGFTPSRGILTGGFPCQDLSIAGKRAGLDGARSGLYWQITRLIDETEPEWVVLENVPGLLTSSGGADMGAVVGALADRGYGVGWRVLDAQNFGVPQRRRRVFIVARRAGDITSVAKVLFERQSVRGDTSSSGAQGDEPARDARQGATVTGGDGLEPIVNRMVGFGDYADDGTFSTTKARDWKDATDLIVEPIAFHMTQDPISGVDSPALGVTSHGMGVMEPAGAHPNAVAHIEIPALLTMREGKDGGGKVPLIKYDQSLTLATGNNQTLFTTGAVRRLTSMECERLQGFPDGWTADQADSHRYKQMGNAVAVPVVEWIINGIVEVMNEQA
jgi:DNA (cytosine-5)-methyltransferase 1